MFLRLFNFFTLLHYDSLFRTLFPPFSLHLHTSLTMTLNWTSTQKRQGATNEKLYSHRSGKALQNYEKHIT